MKVIAKGIAATVVIAIDIIIDIIIQYTNQLFFYFGKEVLKQ